MSLLDNSLVNNAIGVVKANPVATAVGVGGVVAGGLVAAAVVRRKRKKKSKSKSTRKKSTSSRTRRTRKRGRYTPHTAGKRKDRSTKRIRYTKKGQPYVLLRSGKARFIKKSSAKRSHKLKGGRY